MIVKGKVATLYPAQAANPGVPAAGAGKDISGLRNANGRAPADVQIELDPNTGSVTLPGPVQVYLEVGGKVRKGPVLNEGAAIALVAGQPGFSQVLGYIGIHDRMEIVAGGALTGGGSFDGQVRGIDDN